MINNYECRFCLIDEETILNPLISPCKCTGSGKYVHKICLSKWRKTDLRQNQDVSCPVCLANYDENLVSYMEIIPDYNKNYIMKLLLHPEICILITNSSFCVYLLNIPKSYDFCNYNNSSQYICSSFCVMDLLEYFDKPFIYTHIMLSIMNILVFLYYFSFVNNKYKYLITGLNFIWIPLCDIIWLNDITGSYFLFSFLHHLLLPYYFYAHQEILTIMNDNI